MNYELLLEENTDLFNIITNLMNFIDNEEICKDLHKLAKGYDKGRIITQMYFLILERELTSVMNEACKINGFYLLYDLF